MKPKKDMQGDFEDCEELPNNLSEKLKRYDIEALTYFVHSREDTFTFEICFPGD